MTQKTEDVVGPYLVFSWERNAFWRPYRSGYTRFIEKAGRYSQADAEAICRDADYRTNAVHKDADPDVPPSEICFPAPEAIQSLSDRLAVQDDLLRRAHSLIRPYCEADEGLRSFRDELTVCLVEGKG